MSRGSPYHCLLLGALLAGCGDAAGPGGRRGSAIQVVAGGDHACGVDSLGQAWCWGAGNLGQLGNGDTLDSRVPQKVTGGLVVAQISAGDFHACALTRTGEAWCWGTNFTGVLGIGALTGPEPTPLRVAGGHRFSRLSAGGSHTCALEADGTAWCWGQGNNGRLGTGDTLDLFLPSPVFTDQRFVAVTAGSAHSCGLTAQGEAFCWGSNFRGQLGSGDTLDAVAPVPVHGGSLFRAVEAGGYHTCGLLQTGEARCWGNDVTAELGDGRLVAEAVVAPVAVAGDRRFSVLAVGNYHACAITTAGAGWCWGQSVYGKLGNETYLPTAVPVAVAGAHRFVRIAAASNHSCAVAADGQLFCWGRNSLGQLGTGRRSDALAPVEVAPLEP
jgi:alpha-tubulin suppressor-like RCC1 family protein